MCAQMLALAKDPAVVTVTVAALRLTAIASDAVVWDALAPFGPLAAGTSHRNLRARYQSEETAPEVLCDKRSDTHYLFFVKTTKLSTYAS